MLLFAGMELYLNLTHAKYLFITPFWLDATAISKKRYIWDNREVFAKITHQMFDGL